MESDVDELSDSKEKEDSSESDIEDDLNNNISDDELAEKLK